MKSINIFAIIFATSLLILPSCLGNDAENDYSEWKALNEEYLSKAETETLDGKLKYEKIVPDWDPGIYILMQWLNDREENVNELSPISTSTITMNYTLTNIEGDTLDQGANFQSKPNGLITGYWTAVTNMHVNDTVNVVVPYTAGYGAYGSGKIYPFSTLIFGIRLKSIDQFY